MENETIKKISENFKIKENVVKIMFEKIKDMGYNIKDFNNLITEYCQDRVCY